MNIHEEHDAAAFFGEGLPERKVSIAEETKEADNFYQMPDVKDVSQDLKADRNKYKAPDIGRRKELKKSIAEAIQDLESQMLDEMKKMDENEVAKEVLVKEEESDEDDDDVP